MTIDLRRAFDLQYDYHSLAPPDERVSCIDANTYDAQPDGCGHFIGRGATERDAMLDLLDQFAEYDERPAPPKTRVIFTSQFEPPEVETVRGPDPDEQYEDYRSQE